MAVDMFLELTNIEGEAQDAVYKDKKAVDVLAWSWGLSQSGTFHVGGGGGSGKANFQDISITKYIDKSSMVLAQYIASGEHIEKAILTVRKAGGKNPLEYIKITMEKVMVTSQSIGGSGGEDRLTENITLNFAKVDAGYKPQTEKGADEPAIPFTWDIATNAAK